jgi:hypothetical protein
MILQQRGSRLPKRVANSYTRKLAIVYKSPEVKHTDSMPVE